MNIYQLRQQIGDEIVDYNLLIQSLRDYAYPRKKISDWLISGDLIKVKKGLYVFGSHVSRHPYSLEVLANLIYGPSAISLNYALYYYGLIPERVYTVTSITNKRNKVFDTPVGQFTYHYVSPSKFAIGIELLMRRDKSNILIATPEKALCDLVMLEIKNIAFHSEREVEAFLLDDLRFDEEAAKGLDKKHLTDIAEKYQHARLNKFVKYLLRWINKNA